MMWSIAGNAVEGPATAVVSLMVAAGAVIGLVAALIGLYFGRRK